MQHEYAFEMAASAIRFGFGATREVGADMVDLGIRHALVFTDPNLRNLPPVVTALESLESNKVRFTVFDKVRVEPSDESLQDAIRFASAGDYDAFIAIGGGSTIDTAKAANLYSCWPADFLDYVNPPIGKGKPVPGPVKPLIAIPTTAGTGSETTGVSIFDYKPLRAKTGIAHRRLKPTLGIVDPENTRTLPPAVAAASGLDVLCHAVESWTALPFADRPRPERPILRPAYQGSNPISDLWSMEALRLTAQFLRRAVADPSDDDARARDDAGRVVCRDRIRQRGRAFTSWDVVSSSRFGAELQVAWLRCGGPSSDSPRRVGDRECARGIPVHRAGFSRTSSQSSGSKLGAKTDRGQKGRCRENSGRLHSRASCADL